VAVQVLLPKLGLTMETGSIEEWLVAPGTAVKPGEPLMRLATDKVDVDVEAEGEGLFHPVVAAGADLPPGTLIGWLLAEGEAVPGADGAPTDGGRASRPADDAEPLVVGEPGAVVPAASDPDSASGASNGARTGRLFASPNARRVAGERQVDISSLRGTGPNGRIITADVLEAKPGQGAEASDATSASPLIRRAAAAAGVDLGSVPATGPGGRITRSDVAAAAASPALLPGAASGPGANTEVIPLTGMRGVIASRMHSSLSEMAQLTLGTEATMDAAVQLRAQLKEQWAQAGLAVPSITDIIVRAAALALRDHPRLNASVRDDAIHVQPDINVGVAVALDDGLMVPVIQNADRQPISAIAAETRRLSQAARTSKLALPDLEGGTFTVSTLGTYGIDFFTPVITPGQVAILGVGRLRDSVRWNGDVPVRTQVITLSLTFDHRAVDGAPAADYLRSVVARLQNPLTLLA
jgi:pyruvate dehydrogenase E2 component (dihydrolipoamide acetyltransferase)